MLPWAQQAIFRIEVLDILQVLRQAIQDGAQGFRLLLADKMLQSLLRLLAPEHLRAVTAWPSLHGGGVAGAEALLTSVADLLYLPFTFNHLSQTELSEFEEVCTVSPLRQSSKHWMPQLSIHLILANLMIYLACLSHPPSDII